MLFHNFYTVRLECVERTVLSCLEWNVGQSIPCHVMSWHAEPTIHACLLALSFDQDGVVVVLAMSQFVQPGTGWLLSPNSSRFTTANPSLE